MAQTNVNLHEYNHEWKEQFDTERDKLTNIFGSTAIGIEHIGSTSIRGIAAKPIIDILVGVQHLQDIPDFIRPLQEIGYEYVPKPELEDRRFFRKGEWGKGTVHLHMCEFDSNEWKEKLLFRDYLRAHPEVAKEYEELKKKLASLYKHDRQTYTKKKGPFIKAIIEKAQKNE